MTEPIAQVGNETRFRSSALDRFGAGIVVRAGQIVLPTAARSRLSVLIFHRVLVEADPLLPNEMTALEFECKIRALARQFNVLSLSNALARLREGTLPPLAVCLTFDDGYRDNYTTALPILKSLGLQATFFVASGFLDSGRMWNDQLLEIVRRWPRDELNLADWGVQRLPMRSLDDRRKSWRFLFSWLRRIGTRGRTELLNHLLRMVPSVSGDDLMLSREQVREIHASGMEIGCHTRMHPILKRISEDEARGEINDGRSDLEALIQAPIRYFAYPNGVPGDDFDARDVEIVASCGFEAAFSTAWGAATRESDCFQLPRFTPWDKRVSRFLLRLIVSRRESTHRAVPLGGEQMA
jgi:peptidoglycan/xylan/chitin deacetylase (PgdA/CDA1 family)